MVGAPVRSSGNELSGGVVQISSYRARARCQLCAAIWSTLFARSRPRHSLRPRAIVLQEREHIPIVIEGVVAGTLHFGLRLLVAPTLEVHAVNGAICPGAMQAGEAMDQHRIIG